MTVEEYKKTKRKYVYHDVHILSKDLVVLFYNVGDWLHCKTFDFDRKKFIHCMAETKDQLKKDFIFSLREGL